MFLSFSLSSAAKRRALAIELPAGNQILHCQRIVACAARQRLVQPVRLFQRRPVKLDAQPRPIRQGNFAVDNLQRVVSQVLTFLPDPVGINGGRIARRRRADVG
ncbi:Uncharacterised protein [Serratia odorifera]|uniref:Uncharacterized protein n=1 Tax=Serratia odorifera TaxID=618 RepID=A0A3S4FIE7_SEROD|nr:Uncharacterised protein [Serratia odorifera]